MAIDADWIDYWAARYNEDNKGYDDEVLNEVGPGVRECGFYRRADLLTVGRWKTPRVLPRLDSNTDDMIRDITSTALAAPQLIQHLVLTLLHGVGVPMASSLLMVWEPDEHTVIDVRAVKSLVVNEEIGDPAPRLYPPYIDYLAVCKAISQRCRRTLRMVDRALYKANGRTTET